jgi:hypothetical protein
MYRASANRPSTSPLTPATDTTQGAGVPCEPFRLAAVRRTFIGVITLVRLARVLLIFLLATIVISFVIAIGSSDTGRSRR